MKPTSADSQNESREWPRVPQMTGEEFQQSFAVAQLAVKLCALKKAKSNVPLEKENLDPKTFLAQAWQLIQSAREHVLRPQTYAEYFAEHGRSDEAAENVVRRILGAARVPFKNLCDPERKKGDTHTIKLPDVETGKTIEVKWTVYRGEGGERAFDNLFWKYWRENGKNPEADAWRKYGESLLASWKTYGVPPNDFLALARFRRERDNRAENLKKKPKLKRWQRSKVR